MSRVSSKPTARTARKSPTTPKKTVAKSATKKVVSTKKAAPKHTMAKPSPTKPPQPVEMGPVMRKKELLDTVVKKTGMRKNEVKPILETLLVVLGDALRENRELILPPLGKVKVQREKKVNGGRMAIARLRQNDPLSPIDLSLVGPSSTKGSD